MISLRLYNFVIQEPWTGTNFMPPNPFLLVILGGAILLMRWVSFCEKGALSIIAYYHFPGWWNEGGSNFTVGVPPYRVNKLAGGAWNILWHRCCYGTPNATKIGVFCQLDRFPISWTPARLRSKYDPENAYSRSGRDRSISGSIPGRSHRGPGKRSSWQNKPHLAFHMLLASYHDHAVNKDGRRPKQQQPLLSVRWKRCRNHH